MIEPVKLSEANATIHSGIIDPQTLDALSNMLQVTIKDQVLIFKLESNGANLLYELNSSESLLYPQKFVRAEAQLATL